MAKVSSMINPDFLVRLCNKVCDFILLSFLSHGQNSVHADHNELFAERSEGELNYCGGIRFLLW